MSDMGFAIPSPGFKLLDSFADRKGFTPDMRFSGSIRVVDPPSEQIVGTDDDEETSDPLADAYTQGFAAGFEQADTAARLRAEANDKARQALSLSLARLDAELEEQLRLRLRETVAALCESAIAPLALDTNALARRIEKAVSMLARADDERVIRLHPDDIALVSPDLAAQWTVSPDPKLTRGTIRIETASGGIEDGPATWRQAIAEALHDC